MVLVTFCNNKKNERSLWLKNRNKTYTRNKKTIEQSREVYAVFMCCYLLGTLFLLLNLIIYVTEINFRSLAQYLFGVHTLKITTKKPLRNNLYHFHVLFFVLKFGIKQIMLMLIVCCCSCIRLSCT